MTQARPSPASSAFLRPLHKLAPHSHTVPDTTNGRATSNRATSFAPSLRPTGFFQESESAWPSLERGYESSDVPQGCRSVVNAPSLQRASRATSLVVRPKPRHRGIRLVPLLAFRPRSLRRRPPLALRDSSRLDRFATASFPACLRYPRPLQPESHRL